MKRLATVAIILASVLFSTSHAQQVEISGQIRERSEVSAKGQTIRQSPDVSHLLRSRLRADVTVSPDMSVAFEIQDARTFGEKGTVLNNGAKAFDLRQGWFSANNILGLPASVIVGRQTFAYANERILGLSDWGNFGQSFDGAVLRAKFDDVTIDALGAAIVRNENPLGGYRRDVFLTGAWGSWKSAGPLRTAQAFFLFDNPYNTYTTSLLIQQQRYTTGIYAKGEEAGFDYEIDGAYQFGDINNSQRPDTSVTIAANMVGIRAGYTVKALSNLRIGAGFDRLSGSDPKKTDTYGAFNTLYGTNHKFYGIMDYFTNIPLHTGNLGLQDMFGQLSISIEQVWRFALDVHLFSTVTSSGLSNPATQSEYSKNIGKEIDLTIWYSHKGGVDITGGVSIFDFDNARYLLQGRKTTNWWWLQTTARF
jgi:hypothetical protein